MINNNLKTCTPTDDFKITQLNTEFELKLPNDTFYDAFKIENRSMEYLPKSLASMFKNLEIIFVKNASLKEIHKKELKGLENLIIVDLQVNLIEELEKNLFEDNPKLELVDLRSNKIRFIHPMAFNNSMGILPNLKILYLNDNVCIFNNSITTDLLKNIGDCEKDTYKLEERLESFRIEQIIVKTSMSNITDNVKRFKRDIEEKLNNLTNLNDIIQKLNTIEDNQNKILTNQSELKSFLSLEDVKHTISQTTENLAEKYKITMQEMSGQMKTLMEKFDVTPTSSNNTNNTHKIFIGICIGQVILIGIILIAFMMKMKSRKAESPGEAPYEIIRKSQTHDLNISRVTVNDNDEDEYQEIGDFTISEEIYSEAIIPEIPVKIESIPICDYEEINMKVNKSEEDIYSDPALVDDPDYEEIGKKTTPGKEGESSQINQMNEIPDYDVIGFTESGNYDTIEGIKGEENKKVEELPGKLDKN